MEALSQVTGPLTLIPAYGRLYPNKHKAIEDWMAGKDFKIVNGPYCSVRDSINLRLDYSTVWIMWNRCDMVRVI